MNQLSLAGCVIIEKNKILLLHRIKTGWFELPGGKVDSGENTATTAKREIKEELCVNIEIIKKLGEKDFSENNYTMSYTWFLAKILPNQKPQIGEPDKFDDLKFIPISELSNYKLSPNMKNLISSNLLLF